MRKVAPDTRQHGGMLSDCELGRSVEQKTCDSVRGDIRDKKDGVLEVIKRWRPRMRGGGQEEGTDFDMRLEVCPMGGRRVQGGVGVGVRGK